MIKKSIRERLWDRTDRTNPSGCWIWRGAKGANGYGVITVNGKWTPVHRYAWAVTNGEIPPGKMICHTCDTPLCINPAHLFPGTSLENNRDRAAKGRNGDQWGDKNSSAKITQAEVEEIFAQCKIISQKDVARIHGICVGHVYNIIHKKRRAGNSNGR